MTAGMTDEELAQLPPLELVRLVRHWQSKASTAKAISPHGNRSQRPFDFSQCAYRPVAFQVAYLGWPYYGLASQATDTVPTIESHLFHALTRTKLVPGRSACAYSRSGRTDKGVSAFGQTVALRVRSKWPLGTLGTYSLDGTPGTAPVPAASQELDYLTMINALLPPFIRVLAWSPVSPDFHARFDCTYRLYKYFFRKSNLNVEAMQEAASYLVGTHVFTNFCKPDPNKPDPVYERTLSACHVSRLHEDPQLSCLLPRDACDDWMVLSIQGTSFLWHQVRCIMSILFLVGEGKESPQIVQWLLDPSTNPEGKARPAYDIASDLPLVLFECGYKDGTFDWQTTTEDHRKRLAGALVDTWSDLDMQAMLGRLLVHRMVPESSHSVKRWKHSRGSRYTPIQELPRCDDGVTRSRKLTAKRQQQQQEEGGREAPVMAKKPRPSQSLEPL